MKYSTNTTVSVLLIISLIIGCVYCAKQDFEWGTKKKSDVLLHREVIEEKSKVLKVVEKDVEYPKSGVANSKKITYIKVIDQSKKGDGAHVTLKTGGPQEKNVAVHFKSKRGNGFNFVLEIYGASATKW